MQIERIACLALHLSGKFLNNRTRRQLEISGSASALARVLLMRNFESACASAADWISQKQSPDILVYCDDDYPNLLREIDHAPFAVFLRGKREILTGKMVAIVGTREPSAAGRQAASTVTQFYAQEHGCTVVSGIARGVDAIAHHAALQCGAKTIAVLPNGFDHCYPLENRDLYALATNSDNLLLVSEYPPAQKPQRHHFVRRNRIIAGLAELTVFVEGSIKSGAMITVNHALREGREVAALKNPQLTNNAGGEYLCNDGATDLSPLVFSAQNFPESA